MVFPLEEIEPTPNCVIAFLQGATWWEWTEKGASMWTSDQAKAEKEARRLLADNALGIDPYETYQRKRREFGSAAD